MTDCDRETLAHLRPLAAFSYLDRPKVETHPPSLSRLRALSSGQASIGLPTVATQRDRLLSLAQLREPANSAMQHTTFAVRAPTLLDALSADDAASRPCSKVKEAGARRWAEQDVFLDVDERGRRLTP